MRRIFCVEDDESIRELIAYTLTRFEFSVRGFECASDFFAALEEEMPSLVLLDLMLPDLDGMEILEKLKSAPATEKLPVILLTAKSGRVDKIKGLDSGADDYITKPFSPSELVARVKAHLARYERMIISQSHLILWSLSRVPMLFCGGARAGSKRVYAIRVSAWTVPAARCLSVSVKFRSPLRNLNFCRSF